MINRFSLQQLRLFEAVARHRSYTRAAAELHLTQPAVHIQVRRLEDAAGLPLIERLGKQLHLTRAGEEVLGAAQQVLGRLRAMNDALVDMRGSVAGPLKIAVVTSAKFFMPMFLGHFLRDYPRVQPLLTVTNRGRVIERLQANLDDFVVMGQVPEGSDWAAHPFMENPLVVVAHPRHPLARARQVALARLARERFLLREPASGTRIVIERLFADHALPLQPYMELGSSEAIKQAIMAGLGISIMSLHTVDLEVETGRLAIVDAEGFPLRRMWHAVYPKAKRLGLTAQTFLDSLLRADARRAKSAADRAMPVLPPEPSARRRSGRGARRTA